jgi:hypothetical protein
MPHASPDCRVCKSAVSLRMPTLHVWQLLYANAMQLVHCCRKLRLKVVICVTISSRQHLRSSAWRLALRTAHLQRLRRCAT